MKKFLTLIITVAMLTSTMIFSTNAAGSLVFTDTFDDGFPPRNWIQTGDSCKFEWDGYSQCIHGYDSAVYLQSQYGEKYNKWWDKFYVSFDVQIRGFDDKPEEVGRTHSIALWYRDKMENDPDKGGDQQGAVYTYVIEIETGKVSLRKEHNWSYRDANGALQKTSTNVVIEEATLPTAIEVGESAKWFEFGMRVTEGKIECYYDQQLIISAEVDPEDPKYGDFTLNSVDASVGSQKSAILFNNEGNWVALDNFEIWTPDYDFAAATYGDVNGDNKINTADVTLLLKKIAKWEVTINEANADANGDGNINTADVTLLLKYIAKWDVTLGPKV